MVDALADRALKHVPAAAAAEVKAAAAAAKN
jgi:hypothetical protein